MRQENVTFEQVVAYASGELTGREASTVMAYLAVLPEAARTAQRLQEVIQRLRDDDTVPGSAVAVRRALALLQSRDDVPTPDWLAPIRLFATLVFDSRAQFAMAGYRGSAASYQLAFESEPARVDLQILPQDGTVGDRWRVRGQVTVRDDAEVDAVTLVAEHTDTALATAVPDQAGRFKMDSVAGVFDLRIDLDDGTRTVIASRLEIGPDFA
jgi:anti-sigma factor RsiW